MAIADPAIRPAPLLRTLGWAILATLVTFLINTYLSLNLGWGGVGPIFSGNFSSEALWQMFIYAAGIALAVFYVMTTPQHSLRFDARKVSQFNAWLVRGFFWGIVFVGVADGVISFLRVEGLLQHFFDPDMVKQLGRPQWRGTWVHMPLLMAGMLMALVTRTIGFHWLGLLIVVAELAIVFSRFVFSYEQAFMGDLVRLWYAALFLFGSAYTLLHDGHVRVDVLYAGMKSRSKGAINAIGAIVFGMSLCWTILVIGLSSKAAIIYGPLTSFEVSQSGFGMYTKYLMAGFLGIFAITMLIQFVSQLFDSGADYRGDPGGFSSEDIAQDDDPNSGEIDPPLPTH